MPLVRLVILIMISYGAALYFLMTSTNELVIIERFKSYCLPFLLYGLEAVSLTDSNACALDNCNREQYTESLV